jgi:thiosulfate/3-mercaptopyruvate sulfurtransferase
MTRHLVSTAWLAERLNDPTIRIIDVRGHVLPASAPLPHYYAHRDDYERAHIPGAVFVDWTQDIVQPGSPSQDIAEPALFAEVMGRLGVGSETHVVAYDDADSMFAARVWWALRYYGHERVSVLDGGWKKWTAEGRAVSAEPVTVAPAQFIPRVREELRVTARQIIERSDGTVLIDVRTPDEFHGRSSRAKRAGHIPGAVNVPRGALVSADGTMPVPEALRATLTAAGIHLDGVKAITYCNAGVSASYGMLALAQLGVPTAVYDGSWKDWGNNEALPISTD